MKAKKAESGQTLLILQVNKKSQTIFDDKINLHHSLKVLSMYMMPLEIYENYSHYLSGVIDDL